MWKSCAIGEIENSQDLGVKLERRTIGALPPIRSLLTQGLPMARGWRLGIVNLPALSLESRIPSEPISVLVSSQFSWACRR